MIQPKRFFSFHEVSRADDIIHQTDGGEKLTILVRRRQQLQRDRSTMVFLGII